jgi:hydrogenase expression/formation protein HypE
MDSKVLGPGKLPAALLRRLLQMGGQAPAEVLLPPAIGEDACAIAIGGGALVAATDPITLTAKEIGGHAVVINANDVAVTGVRPRWFLAVVLLPPGTGAAAIEALFADMYAALARLGVALVGGHTEITAAVTQPIVVGQMLGFREDGRFVRTAGMRAGDVVLQIGQAPVEGAAVLANEALQRLGGLPPDLLEFARQAVREPGISVVEPALLAAELGAHALHDPTEGGLSAGLHELAEASSLALLIDREAVLWFAPAGAVCAALGADPWGVLASGTLLAAFSLERVEHAQAALAAAGHASARLGRAEDGEGVRTIAGSRLRRFEQDEVSRILDRGLHQAAHLRTLG